MQISKYVVAGYLLCVAGMLSAQTARPVYHPCFLMDSVEKHVDFIRNNANRIFVDSFDCRQALFNRIADKYIETKDKKYLDLLASLRSSSAAEKVENLYTDVMKRLLQDDLGGLIDQLYNAKGRYITLEKELITTLNMIIDGRPLKQKYMGLINVEVSKAKDKKDNYKVYYLEKLKMRIEEDKF